MFCVLLILWTISIVRRNELHDCVEGRWNQQSTKQHQIVGKRLMALRLLLDTAPAEALKSILEHVSALSWADCVWCEDTLCNKKIYPKHQFPSKSKRWLVRNKTTEESFILMVQRAQNTWESSASVGRTKLTTTELESLAERAAACLSLAAELQLTVPIKDTVIEEQWVGAWRGGSDQVDVELQAVLLDKSNEFDVTLQVPNTEALDR